jgi:hypothetical protein
MQRLTGQTSTETGAIPRFPAGSTRALIKLGLVLRRP